MSFLSDHQHVDGPDWTVANRSIMEFLRKWHGRPQQWNYFAFLQTALEDGSGDICIFGDKMTRIDDVCTSWLGYMIV